jgi:hypothetical protein
VYSLTLRTHIQNAPHNKKTPARITSHDQAVGKTSGLNTDGILQSHHTRQVDRTLREIPCGPYRTIIAASRDVVAETSAQRLRGHPREGPETPLAALAGPGAASNGFLDGICGDEAQGDAWSSASELRANASPSSRKL